MELDTYAIHTSIPRALMASFSMFPTVLKTEKRYSFKNEKRYSFEN